MRHLDAELSQLKEKLLAMGGAVEKSVEHATQALLLRDLSRFKEVYALEAEINRSHVEVDNACVNLLARQSPMAADLRLIIAVIKINADLERMGDQAVNISHNGEYYLAWPELKPLVDIPIMAERVRVMVRAALDAFVKLDEKQAQLVLECDDEVDQLKQKIFLDLLGVMKQSPENVERGLNLILVARNLERIGDHATNIAEDVIFALNGVDIRHRGIARP